MKSTTISNHQTSKEPSEELVNKRSKLVSKAACDIQSELDKKVPALVAQRLESSQVTEEVRVETSAG